eukprot:2021485-Pyramimonas_sp.AAC.1
MGCMKHWLKANQDPKADESRGEERKEFQLKFLVLQLREKKAKKDMVVGHSASSSNQEKAKLFWWSLETMDKELGVEKSKAWR